MTTDFDAVVHGDRWRSLQPLWVEDEAEHSWAAVSRLADSILAATSEFESVRVLHVRADSRLGCFAGQLAAWRGGFVAVADDGRLGAPELDLVRPDVSVRLGEGGVEQVQRAVVRLPPDRLPDEIVAVNFTSGTSGRRKAVGVTRENLLALWRARTLGTPLQDGTAAASFAGPTFDGWWFDTWRTVADGGVVVCLPGVNEDVFEWPDLIESYGVARVLLPAAVVATLIEAVPGALAEIPTIFSGGERFRPSTYRQARQVGLRNRFVNLYGPTEATFATHGYVLTEQDASTDDIPIGTALEVGGQELRPLDEGHELIVTGASVCHGYLAAGTVARRFVDSYGRPSYPTADVVRADADGNLIFVGRLDGQLKVNGLRVDAAAVEQQVAALPGVADCRVLQEGGHTVAFVRTDTGAVDDAGLRSAAELAVGDFSAAIAVELVARFPLKAGGKVDAASLLAEHLLAGNGAAS